MKNKFLTFVSTSLFVITSTFTTLANAGVITDTDHNSFIDTNSGLEWMDFGINNHLTPAQVTSQLTTTYAGWSLATQSQVLALADNVFNTNNTFYTSNITNNRYATYSGIQYNNLNNIAAMGLNIQYGTNSLTGDAFGYSLGWFNDDNGSLSYLYLNSQSNGVYYGHVHGQFTNYSVYNHVNSNLFSTLLVKDAVAVSEPASIAILGLALIGFCARRYKSA